MDLQTWLAYVAAYTVLSLVPGPSVFMVLGQSLARGFRPACLCIAGDVAGGVVVMAASYAGLGVLLAASSTAFAALKWAGAAYMAWLGVAQIRAARRITAQALAAQAEPSSRASSFRAGFLTGILNPKAILFYAAFLVQFIDPASPVLPQFVLLMATSSMIVVVVLLGYASLAAQARNMMRSVKARKRIGYAGGAFLLGGSAVMARSA